MITDLHAQNNALEQCTNMVLQNHMILVSQMVCKKEGPQLLTDKKNILFSHTVGMKILNKSISFKVFSDQKVLVIHQNRKQAGPFPF